MTDIRMGFKEFSSKHLTGKPLKLSKPQKEFMKMIEKHPHRKLVINTRRLGRR